MRRFLNHSMFNNNNTLCAGILNRFGVVRVVLIVHVHLVIKITYFYNKRKTKLIFKEVCLTDIFKII